MSTALRFYYRNNDGGISEMVDRVMVGETELVVQAEEGSVGNCSLPVHDPDATFAIRGHRKVYAVAEAIDASTDMSAGVIGVWYTGQARTYERLTYRTEQERVVTLSLDDLNAVLSRRLLASPGAKRPAETDLERIAWLLTNHVMDLVDDDSLVSTTGAVDMDDADYTKQSAFAVLADCAQQSGKDYFVFNLKQTPDADGDPCLFSLFYDFTEAEVLETDLRISNDLADVDNVDTYAPAMETRLSIDPAQVYSGCIVDYAGGWVYVTRSATATDFAVGGRDTTFSAPNVKSATTAKTRGRRYLNTLATEQHTVSTSIIVAGSHVNRLQAGMRVQVKFTHFSPEGYGDFVWMRVLNRTVRELQRDVFEIAVEMTRDILADSSGSSTVFGIFYSPAGPMPSDGFTRWTWEASAPGYPAIPTVGLIESITDPDPTQPDRPFKGWKINGTGDVDVNVRLDCVWVTDQASTITCAIVKNGAIVESDVYAHTPGGLGYYTHTFDITATGIPVVPDDVITVLLTQASPQAYFRTPSGAGDTSFRFAITGGTLT